MLKRITGEEIVNAQLDYIERCYNQVKVVLSFPLAGWRRQECLLKAQLEADRKAIESCETTTVLDKEDDSKNYEAYLVPVKSIKEYQQLKDD